MSIGEVFAGFDVRLILRPSVTRLKSIFALQMIGRKERVSSREEGD